MHKVLVNLLGGLSLPRKSVVRLIDRPDVTFTVKVKQQHSNNKSDDVPRKRTVTPSTFVAELCPFEIFPMKLISTL